MRFVSSGGLSQLIVSTKVNQQLIPEIVKTSGSNP